MKDYPQGTAWIAPPPPGGAPLPLTERTMAPVQPLTFTERLRHAWRYGSRRFHIFELSGTCLASVMPERFGVIDLEAEIREGDLFTFLPRDMARAFPEYPASSAGIVKRFHGLNSDRAFLECSCSDPPAIIHTGLTNIVHAARFRAVAYTFAQAKALLKAVRADPDAFDDRLLAEPILKG